MATPARRRLEIEGQAVEVHEDETVLDAALRAGVAIPHRCRVGGCGSCRCRLVRGEVRELTETAYLLSAEELASGTILACQSVPRGDVVVALAERGEERTGTVIGRERVTPDIVRVTIRLATPLAYRAGQSAAIAFAGLPGVVRSYSFGAPPREDGVVELFVRRVPGGRLSGYVHEAPLVGEELTLRGPEGDFWLRPGEAPLVLVAGGSGLAPLLAMLEHAVATGETTRPATLLFGARTEADLYALGRIAAVAERWSGGFTFVPVLSAEPADSAWSGDRGLVTERITAHVGPDAHVYVCGPPAMVDAARAIAMAAGVPATAMWVDRFAGAAPASAETAAARTHLATAASAARRGADHARDERLEGEERAPAEGRAPGEVAGVLAYAKFFGFHAVGLCALAFLLAGGVAIPVGLAAVVAFYVLGDAFGGDDVSTPHYRAPGVLRLALWLALPLVAALVFVSTWTICPGDPLHFGATASRLAGRDLLAARAATGPLEHLAAWGLTGLMIGMLGTIPAHELTHRTWDRASLAIGRWLLAFSFDTAFAIEHVYGHHRYVATTADPATAPRGRNVYAHVVISTVRGNASAWAIERARLARRGLPWWSPRNAFLRGQAASLALVAGAAAMGGGRAVGWFLASAAWGKALLEIVNYMEHYGLVREPETPVAPRHSWNTNRRLSSWTLFHLTRHSHHHAEGEVPFHRLRPYPDAPQMVGGYLTTILVTLVPPLWRRLMAPKLAAWDARRATPAERRLAAAADARQDRPGALRSA